MRYLLGRQAVLPFLAILSLLAPRPARGGVTNPQISILGQPRASWTDDAADPDHDRLRMDPAETEIVFDDYLNPYARGYFTLALAEEGMELEEGYFTLFRGLPLDVALRGGRFRAPFGRVNPVHPHLYPFAEPFAVLSAYLPGEEGLIETGAELSRRFAVAGDFSVNAQAAYLQGNGFRAERDPSAFLDDPLSLGGDDDAELSRPAFLGRLSAFGMLGERSAFELGATGAGGTNNVAAGTRTTLLGVDAKAKLWRSPSSYLLLQAEGLRMDREDAAWDSIAGGYVSSEVTPAGGYVFADCNFGLRYNVGASFERFQEPTAARAWAQGVGLFAGLALLEESTAFRLDWRRVEPDAGPAIQTITLRAVFSMGPHKAHQF